MNKKERLKGKEMEREWDGESKGERVNPLKVFFCVFLLFFFRVPEKILNLELLPHFFLFLASKSSWIKQEKNWGKQHTKKKLFDILPEINERVEQSSSHDDATKHEKRLD